MTMGRGYRLSGLKITFVNVFGLSDHAGAAQALAEKWDVPVYAHRLEFPYLTGDKEYPAPDWKAGGGLMPLMSPILPRGPIDLGRWLKALPGEGAELTLAEMPGWKLIHTPGHTPGHVSFFRESDGTLLVGDAFCTTKPESFFTAPSRSRQNCMSLQLGLECGKGERAQASGARADDGCAWARQTFGRCGVVSGAAYNSE
jgi:hypothetical protein